MSTTLNPSRVSSPGKFEGELLVTNFAYELSLAGCDDEAGSCDGPIGWNGKLVGPFSPDGPFCDITPEAIREFEFTAADLAFLASTAGVILTENSDGFVSGRWYEAEGELEADWAEILDDEADSDG